MRDTVHSPSMFPSFVAKGFRFVFMLTLLFPAIASSQVQESALKASLKGAEAVAIVTIGGAAPGVSGLLPVNTLAYPDGHLIYRVEYGFNRREVTQMETSFGIGTRFHIGSVDLKDDRLELKLNGPSYSGSGRLKLMLGPDWQTRMSNEGVISAISKFLTLPSAATSGGTANSPSSSAVVVPAPARVVAALRLPSTYVSAQTPADKLQLNADGSFSLQEGGQPFHGAFVTNGNTLELNISETNTKATLSRQGNDLIDSSAQTWNLRE